MRTESNSELDVDRPPGMCSSLQPDVPGTTAGGWMPKDLWQARIVNIQTQYARDDENALLNATLKL
jgi:hypothetical protein